jgi:DNA polymerase-3 subunit beta
MKVKCQQKDLNFALNLVNRAVTPNTTLPVLNNILIKAQGKKLYFSATNLEVAFTYFIEADVLNEGAITIPSKLITNYIALLREEEVELKLEEGFNLSIKTPLAHTKIKGIDFNEFPALSEVERGQIFSIESETFHQAIEQTGFSTSTNVSRPVLTGILFQVDDQKLSMVSTDSYRLSEKTLSTKTPFKEPFSCIVPAKTVIELGKILINFPKLVVECQVTKNQIQFSINNLRVISRLIEGNFPDYKRIIPASAKTTLKVKVDELVLAVKKVSLFVQETNNNIKMSVTHDGKLILATDETQIGEGTVEVDVVMEGENNKVALNAHYILDMLSHTGSDEVEIAIDNKLSPVKINPVQKDSQYTHIIMPLKV